MSVVGLVVGAICALIVYAVGTEITEFRREDLIWGLIALLVWAAFTFGWRGRDFR